MKRTLKLLTIVLLGLFVFTSCVKEMSNDSSENGSAVISGTAYVQLDLTTPELEYVPSGTQIYATINSSDLVEFPSAGVNYGDIVYTAQVGSNGTFSFTVAANVNPVTVTFSSDDFSADQTQPDDSVEETIFYLPAIYSEVVMNGMTRITEVAYFVK